jgi:hypothetical protein
MEFRTQFSVKPIDPGMDFNSRIFLTGSCFVENIGEKLDYYKIRNFRNPFGILYHPAAIGKLIIKSIRNETYSSEDIFFHNERWHCFDTHSALSDPSESNLLNKLNAKLKETAEYLENATHVVITLGTAWVYRNIVSEELVANCHKLPQKNFAKEITGVEELKEILKRIISAVKGINSGVGIIFTISPVRHIKDGTIENQRSKAHLIAALHGVVEEGTALVNYFPAYEIMNDDLRDYRFYGKDMLHPTPVAVDYIWQKFIASGFSPESSIYFKEVEAIQKSLAHKAFNPDSESHKKFQISLEKRILDLKRKAPFIQF